MATTVARPRPTVPKVDVSTPRWFERLPVWASMGGFLLILMVASVAALVLNPLVRTLERAHVPRGLAILTTATSSMLAIDDDEAWMRNVARRQARLRGAAIETDVPGMGFLEIDGKWEDHVRYAVTDDDWWARRSELVETWLA